MEKLFTHPGCVLGYHYKAFQLLNLVCRTPAVVSLEVSVKTTKGPLLCHVVLRRLHTCTHSFPTKWIHRESTLPAPLIGTPNLPVPHTMPGHTHVHGCTIFLGGHSMNQSLDLGMMTTVGFRSPPDKALNYQSPPNIVPNLSP
jgi:hypothetical protein